jgi:hypothetical protein
MTKRDKERLAEARTSMARLRTTFLVGDNRYGEYGRNVRDAYNRWAKTVLELTGEKSPSIYGD